MNSPYKCWRVLWICILACWLALSAPVMSYANTAEDMTPRYLEQIESWVQEQMEHAEIPGMSVTIVSGDQIILQRGYGFKDVSAGTAISPSTLFEIGSNSKAFTGLAVLKLAKENRLHLDDPVSKYLPWFQPVYHNQPAVITIEQLLHHTSGIPFDTIGHLPEGYGAGELERTVRILQNQPLNRAPGKTYEYATINYDVLGLIIEQVSEQSYAEYMKDNIFEPLGMKHTFAVQEPIASAELASGYKMAYTRPQLYSSPPFVGNAPAGYIVSNAEDMALWLKIQMGIEHSGSFEYSLIDQSHLPNRTVPPESTGASYAVGWDIFQSGEGEISHSGNNPTFSSFVGMRPAEGIGVVIMANMNSDYTQGIGQGILSQLHGEEPPLIHSDTYKKADSVAVGLIIALSIIGAAVLVYLVLVFRDIGNGKRKPSFQRAKPYRLLGYHLIAACLFAWMIYKAPDILMYKLTWRFIEIWLPSTVMTAVWLLLITGALYMAYSLLTLFFPKNTEKSFLTPIVLGLVSGLGNAFVIFIINESFNRTDNLLNGLLFYFAMALAMYVFGQRIIRAMLIKLTNQIIYAKRMELVDKFLQTSFSKMDSFERGRVEATLNNDTEAISRSMGILISGATNLITLLCCFLYLGIMNMYALLLSIVIIAVLAVLYMYVGSRANHLMEETRDLQNVFFKFINDLLKGFKELSLHSDKRREFREEMQISCETYKEKRNVYQLRYSDIFVLGELLFILVIGCVVFVFPELFKQMDTSMLRNYVFVFLYMTGPVNQLLDSVPQYAQSKVSWDRIKQMIREVEQRIQHPSAEVAVQTVPIRLQLEDVTYRYTGNNTSGPTGFAVGPINCSFDSGSITFITGGNGSGKSTLAKLLTGLYIPDTGKVTLNDGVISSYGLGEYYSAIFGDFHLFDRLYGIDWQAKEAEMQHYLRLLDLQDKIVIHNGTFSTTKLSTGQKKRLALLIAYLEDRPICLFDEWAADQDPEYRRFFYYTLLPDMKDRGKCIIAITHDDHYFHLADRIIKMDGGRIVAMQQTTQTVVPLIKPSIPLFEKG
ncbi:cyclic peptide export ABC transporter [Paenibacillaceae sp. P-4]|uniref:cyclic peptide export ABC transporter n=1 Tax=Paenibacillaceae bacterium P-4 TaxID=3160969 RepID=UPI0032E80BBB